MTRLARLAVAAAALAPPALAPFASFVSSSACSSAGECDCGPTTISIQVPADIASSLTAANIQLGGPACTNAAITCANQTNGCTAYDFSAVAAGECDIQVTTPSTVFTDTIQIVAQTGCCAGYYPSPSSDNTVDVPEPEDGG